MKDTTERRVTVHDIKTMAKEAKGGLFWMLSKS